MENQLTLLDEMENANKQLYTSLSFESEEDRKLLFKISENADTRVSENLNKPIALKHVFLQRYDKINEETGELEKKTRTILVDDKNKSYASASRGLYNSLLKFMSIVGRPDQWSAPMMIKVVEVQLSKGKTYKILPVD